jgi:hypothetical protein
VQPTDPAIGRLRHVLSTGFGTVGMVVFMAACGSSGSQRQTSPDPLLARSECMRAHGVKNFPDPVGVNGSEGFPNTIARPGSSSVSIEGIAFSGPASVAAEKACAAGGAADHGPRLTEARKEAFIAQARCIREHGVPNFPDSTFGPAGWGIRADLAPGENPASPAMRAAEKACANIGSPLPGV